MAPPPGYNSCHGVKSDGESRSVFQDDEYVVYDPRQQRLKYLIQFHVAGDSLKDGVDVGSFVGMKVDSLAPSDIAVTSSHAKKVDLSDVKSVADPMEKVTAGLVAGDASLPLISVHVRASIKDLVGQVVVLQEYRNDSSSPIEAKYVFPLDELAAVCGFEGNCLSFSFSFFLLLSHIPFG